MSVGLAELKCGLPVVADGKAVEPGPSSYLRNRQQRISGRFLSGASPPVGAHVRVLALRSEWIEKMAASGRSPRHMINRYPRKGIQELIWFQSGCGRRYT